MITIRCDRCEETLTYDDSFAGEKVECPHCGDVNRLPDPNALGQGAERQPSVDGARDDGRDARPTGADRAAAAGYPPDAGPEARVVVVRQSLVRSKPFTAGLLALFPLALSIFLYAVIPGENRPTMALVALPIAGWAVLGVWVMMVRLSASLEITNKRTVLRTGFLRRSSSEVLHDHVRNIEIDQSFRDRCLHVGRLGISSSGQDGIEVQADRLPNPKKIREIIDLYRPL